MKNMKKKRNGFVFFAAALSAVLAFSLVGVSAAQAFDLSLVGVTDMAQPSLLSGGTTQTASGKLALGAGALLGLGVSMGVELEIGALYAGRHFSVAGNEDSYSSYEVPVLLRLTGLHYLTFGAGLYYAVPTGDDTHNSASQQSTTLFKNDLGAVGSVALKFPISPVTDFLIDGRYLYGLTNATQTAGDMLKYRDIQVLFGLDFGF